MTLQEALCLSGTVMRPDWESYVFVVEFEEDEENPPGLGLGLWMPDGPPVVPWGIELEDLMATDWMPVYVEPEVGQGEAQVNS